MPMPAPGARKPCRGESPEYPCNKVAVFMEHVTAIRDGADVDGGHGRGVGVQPQSGPGWQCVDGHVELWSEIPS
jgi:hypothetical protein